MRPPGKSRRDPHNVLRPLTVGKRGKASSRISWQAGAALQPGAEEDAGLKAPALHLNLHGLRAFGAVAADFGVGNAHCVVPGIDLGESNLRYYRPWAKPLS